MLQLPHGCSCSTPTVFPKNWETGGPATLKFDWKIWYYFRDPDHPTGKQIVLKRMNRYNIMTNGKKHVITEMQEPTI